MSRTVLSAVIIAGLFGSGGPRCALDPWTTGEMPTDVITVSKTISTPTADGRADDTVYAARIRPVRMSHKEHEESGVACVRCHHRNNNPEREKKCAACHRGGPGYETIHGLCRGCHDDRRRGPRSCGDCH